MAIHLVEGLPRDGMSFKAVQRPLVAVLFARVDSVYKTLPDCDVWDADRDARRWPGGCPVVAHPPCRAWGRMRQFAKPRDDERDLAFFAVEQVRRFGGVLEHPVGSQLWPVASLPAPGRRDRFGGWTLPIHQHWWGHKAEKATLLYVVGVEPLSVPSIPFRIDQPTHCIRPAKGSALPTVTKAEREHTPALLAAWLVDLARRVEVR